jgi:hypothetical protein
MTRSSSVLNLMAGLGGALTMAVASSATAAATPDETAVDVTIAQKPTPQRVVSIEWNPVALFTIGRLSFNGVIVPGDHHALILSPFYEWTNTAPIYVFDDQGNPTQLPQQKFSGFGGEIGYRYYTGKAGPRGFFAGPSFIIGAMTATAQNGQQTTYQDLGLAVDVGYEMLVADTVALSLGVGIQYTTPDKSIPSQQFPADIYANSGVWPRALGSIGWAF